jgi:UDP-2-acetamido-3-amino-2,3-dideoxy-glucuronate N-acetyltransferase
MAPADPVAIDSYEPLRAECQHFLECVKTRATPRTDGAEGLRVLTVLQRCEEALSSGRKLGVTGSQPAARNFFAHESAFIDEGVEIDEGTTIWHVSHVMKGSKIGKKCRIGQNVVIGPDATIGNGVKIQNNVSVYQGVTLEDDVFCGPSMVFTNVLNPRSEIARMHELEKTLVRKGATLGANCTIVCGTTIGRWAFVGAGAVVTKDVPDFALVLGNPGRIAGWMCRCGVRLALEGKAGTCRACSKRYVLDGASLVEA